MSSVKNSMVQEPYLILNEATLSIPQPSISHKCKDDRAVKLSQLGFAKSAGSDFKPSSLKNSLPLSQQDNEVVTTSFDIYRSGICHSLRPRKTISEFNSHQRDENKDSHRDSHRGSHRDSHRDS